MLIALIVLAWVACGGLAVWLAYRKWERFERGLNLKYPLVARPVTRKRVFDGVGRKFLVVIGLLGPYGLLGILIIDGRGPLTDSQWREAKYASNNPIPPR